MYCLLSYVLSLEINACRVDRYRLGIWHSLGIRIVVPFETNQAPSHSNGMIHVPIQPNTIGTSVSHILAKLQS